MLTVKIAWSVPVHIPNLLITYLALLLFMLLALIMFLVVLLQVVPRPRQKLVPK